MGDSAEPLEGGILVLVTVPLAMLTLRPACFCPPIFWTGTTPFEVSPEYERTCLDCCLLVLPPLLLLPPTNRKLPLPDLLDLDRPFLVVLVVPLAVLGEAVGAVIRLSAAAAAGWTFLELPP